MCVTLKRLMAGRAARRRVTGEFCDGDTDATWRDSTRRPRCGDDGPRDRRGAAGFRSGSCVEAGGPCGGNVGPRATDDRDAFLPCQRARSAHAGTARPDRRDAGEHHDADRLLRRERPVVPHRRGCVQGAVGDVRSPRRDDGARGERPSTDVGRHTTAELERQRQQPAARAAVSLARGGRRISRTGRGFQGSFRCGADDHRGLPHPEPSAAALPHSRLPPRGRPWHLEPRVGQRDRLRHRPHERDQLASVLRAFLRRVADGQLQALGIRPPRLHGSARSNPEWWHYNFVG